MGDFSLPHLHVHDYVVFLVITNTPEYYVQSSLTQKVFKSTPPHLFRFTFVDA